MVVWLNNANQTSGQPTNFGGNSKTSYFRRSFLSQGEVESVKVMKSRPLVPVPDDIDNVSGIGYCCSCMPKSSVLSNRNFYQIYSWRNILNYPSQQYPKGKLHSLLQDIYYCIGRQHSYKYHSLRCKGIDELSLSNDTIIQAGVGVIKRFIKSVETGFNMAFIRLTGYLFFKLFPLISRGILVDEGKILAIKDASKHLAVQNGEEIERCPCVFLPLHSSHLDYLIIAFVAFCNDFPLPFVGAGNNLDIPIVKYAIKMTGGFFIKRGGSTSIKKPGQLNTILSTRSFTNMAIDGIETKPPPEEDIARAVLRWTLKTLLSNNQSIEFYLEGTRTRNGRPCMPRTGLLSLLVDCLDKGDIPDICIVPTSLTYEHVWEIEDLVKEQLGHSKQSESLWSSIKAALNIFRTFCGLIRVDFGEPFSLREFLKNWKNMQNHHSTAIVFRNPSSPASMSPDISAAAGCLSYHVLFDCTRIAPVTLTHALAFTLMFKFRQGHTIKTIAKHMRLLRREIIARGYDVTFCDDEEERMSEAVLYAAKVFGGDVITIDRNMDSKKVYLYPSDDLKERMVLNYYAGRVLNIFAAEAIVATSFVAATKLDKERLALLIARSQTGIADLNESDNVEEVADTEFKVDRNTLLERAEVLTRLLSREFIIAPPCRAMSEDLLAALNRLLSCKILRYREAPERPFVNPDVADLNGNFDEDSDDDYSDIEDMHFGDESEESDHEPTFRVTNNAPRNSRANVPRGPIIELDLENSIPAAKRLLELHNYIVPLLEPAWVTACNIAIFAEDPTLVQKDRDFVLLCQRDAIDTYADGNISFPESASIGSLSNALKYFETLGFVSRRATGEGNAIYLELGAFAATNINANIIEALITLYEYFRLCPDSHFPGCSSLEYALIGQILNRPI